MKRYFSQLQFIIYFNLIPLKMKFIDFLKEIIDKYHISDGKNKNRKMRRVFQWSRFLEWKDLTNEEKLSAKRLILVPIAAYFIFIFISQYMLTLIFLICIYLW